jgi:hypothetical protein
MTYFPARTAVIVALVASAHLAGGCASQQPVAPAAPPAPTQLTIHAERGQSQAQQSRDRGECESLAAQQASSSATWAAAFTDCMTGRGYAVR